MTNISITTHPTGRSPENKYFFGKQAEQLDLSRPKFNKIGKGKDFANFYALMQNQKNYLEPMNFETVGTNFTLHTNDERHKQFVWNMFKVTAEDQTGEMRMGNLALVMFLIAGIRLAMHPMWKKSKD